MKLRTFFIGDFLSRTDDVFEKARAIMLFQFVFAFALIFILPLIADYQFGLYKAFFKHLIDWIAILLLLFLLRKMKSVNRMVNIFFIYTFITYMMAFIMLNPEKLDAIALLWATFFFVLSTLMQRGRARLLYCLFLGWLPVIFVLVNIQLKGALTIHWITEKQPESPFFILLIPISLIIIAVWSHTNTMQTARETITAQKQLIEEKNKNIVDSIQYAKRIQQSLMPTEKQVEKLLKKCVNKKS